MIPFIIIPFFFGLMAFYFLIKFYYLKTVYVFQINPTKTVSRSESCEIKDVQHLIQIIKARRESQTSLNKFCSSSSLDDLSEAIHEHVKSNEQTNSTEIDLDNTFSRDHIPDLNRWLESSQENSNKVPSTESSHFIQIDLNSDEDDKKTKNRSTQAEPMKFLNLRSEQFNGKQLQILISLSYLVNEERLSVLVCKLKLPLIKNLYQQFPLYRTSNMISNQNNSNVHQICQQLELIKQTKYIFVKIHLIDSSRKRISKKTSLLPVDGQNTILNNNPYDQYKYIIINEMMIFKLPIDQLSKVTIRLSVLGLSSLTNFRQQMMNRSNFRTKKIKKSIDTLYSFGQVEIGHNSLSKSGFTHFRNLLNNLHKPVCMMHSLDLSKQTKRKSSISS